MNVSVCPIGDAGITQHIYELIAVAEAYKDLVRCAIRIAYPGPSGTDYTYGLVIALPSGSYWIPYCSRNTTDYSGEGGRGHRAMEAALERLGIPVREVTAQAGADEAVLLQGGWRA